MPTPEDQPLSVQLERFRGEISALRSGVSKLSCNHSLAHVEGALTCLLVTLARHKDDAIDHEVKRLDAKLGPSFMFRPRGIGLDACPACFVCGALRRTDDPAKSPYLNNISGFVQSKADGEAIVQWFQQCGHGGARLDYRPSEPSWIQVKVGACDHHMPQLERLHALTSRYGRIWQSDIITARDYLPGDLPAPASVAPVDHP